MLKNLAVGVVIVMAIVGAFFLGGAMYADWSFLHASRQAAERQQAAQQLLEQQRRAAQLQQQQRAPVPAPAPAPAPAPEKE